MKHFIALASLALTASSAIAAPAVSTDKLYVGVDMGRTKIKLAGQRGNDHANAAGLTMGYEAWRNVSVEVAARVLANDQLSRTTSASIHALQLSALGQHALNDDVAVTARVGLSRVSSSVQPLVGLGVSYEITKNVKFRAEYTNLGESTVSGRQLKLRQFNWGVNYHF